MYAYQAQPGSTRRTATLVCPETRSDTPRSGPRTGSRREELIALSEKALELAGLGNGPFAGESLAHVGGGTAVHGLATLEQRNAVGLAAREHEVRPELAAHGALQRAHVVAHERDLLHGREVEVHRLEQVGERLRVLERDLVQQAEDADRPVLVVVLAGQRGQPQQAVGGARVAGGDGVVLQVLATGQELLVVRRGLEEAAALLVGEARDHRVGELASGTKPARVERRLVEREERLEEEGVVLQVCVQLRLAVLVSPEQPTVGVAEAVED